MTKKRQVRTLEETVSTKLPEYIGMSQDGTKEMTDLFGAKVFSYPKPTALLAYLLKIATKSEDLEAVLISYNDNYIVCHFDAICISFRHLFLVSLLE